MNYTIHFLPIANLTICQLYSCEIYLLHDRCVSSDSGENYTKTCNDRDISQWSRKQLLVAGATDTGCGCGFDY